MSMKKNLVIAMLASGVVLLTLAGLVRADVSRLARECGDCHGRNGNSTDPKVPNIAGYSASYIKDALEDYRDGERPALKYREEDGDETDMTEIAKKLSDEDIKAIAKHYAALTFKSHAAEQQTDPALVARGEKLFKRKCRKCHTDFGTDPEDDAGILGGQWMEYLRHQFELFASGEREMPKKMKKKFRKIKESDYEAIIQALGSK